MRTRKHRTLGALENAPELYKQYYKQYEKAFKKDPTYKLKWWEEDVIKDIFDLDSRGDENRELYQKARFEALIDRLNLREKVTRFFDKWPAQKLKALTYQCPKHILIKYLNSIEQVNSMLLFKIDKLEKFARWHEEHVRKQDIKIFHKSSDWNIKWNLYKWTVKPPFISLVYNSEIGIGKEKMRVQYYQMDNSLLIQMLKDNIISLVGEFSNRGEEHVINGLEAYIFRTKGLIDNMFIPVAELEFLEQKKETK